MVLTTANWHEVFVDINLQLVGIHMSEDEISMRLLCGLRKKKKKRRRGQWLVSVKLTRRERPNMPFTTPLPYLSAQRGTPISRWPVTQVEVDENSALLWTIRRKETNVAINGLVLGIEYQRVHSKGKVKIRPRQQICRPPHPLIVLRKVHGRKRYRHG